MFDVVKVGKLRVVVLAFVLLAGLMASGAARSSVIYDFSGGFDGGTVTGVLTLSDAYSPGAALAENSTGGAVFFISYEQSVTGFASLIMTPADFQLVAGGVDPINGASPSGDGPLPGVPGIPSFADIYVTNEAGTLGINDYSIGTGGAFILSNDGISIPQGREGRWTLRATAVPEPGTAVLLGLCLVGLAFNRRRGGPTTS